MRFIRVFLWGLVAAMTLQGFLHADDYGSAVSFFGGVSMTLSIWKENVWSHMRALVPGIHVTQDNEIPRALVIAALQESARHPGLHTLPTLRRALANHRRTWDIFREEEVQWMLTHADLIGALRAEGHTIWQPTWSEHAILDQQYTTVVTKQCNIPMGAACTDLKTELTQANTELTISSQKVSAWTRLLDMDASLPLLEWWNLTMGNVTQKHMNQIIFFETALSTLHNVTALSDVRIQMLRANASVIADELGGGCRWRNPIVKSLLLRNLWSTCLLHIHKRESRVQEMMVATGVQELYNTHERLLGAAMRSVHASEAQIVQEWFDVIANYAWWLSEDVPSIVRRCIGQNAGECRRIGVTEITSLVAQFDERSRIIKDWTRCLFIGMWNAMPAVGLLFIVEFVVLLIPHRHIHTFIAGDGKDLTQFLESGSKERRSRSVNNHICNSHETG
jgi:hypothetical protein